MIALFLKLKYYFIIVLLALGLYTWAGFAGVRFTGDDEHTEDRHSGHSGSHGFYHK